MPQLTVDSRLDLVSTSSRVLSFGQTASEIDRLDPVVLLQAQRAVSEAQRQLDRHKAWIAAAIARKSSRELGQTGLAQSQGFVSPEALIQSVAGVSRAEAAKLIGVGAMLSEADASPITPSFVPAAGWQRPIAAAMERGALSLDGAEAIRRGVGSPDEVITSDLLGAAVEQVIAGSRDKSVEQLHRDARQARTDLDFESIVRREKQQRDLRFLRARRLPDGMVSGRFLLAPEDGAFVIAALDAITSPRRGGPRWVDPATRESAHDLLNDPRSNEQIHADTLVDLLRVAVEADPARFPGATRPAVRVVTTERVNLERQGYGLIEGTVDALSYETLSRHLCNDGLVPVQFDDDGQCVNVGRDQRRFTTRQRVGMAVRDGGCTFPGCDRPPSWCEAHHVDFWGRDNGRTDIAEGVLLCRRHHLLLHNDGWEIVREGGRYWLIPPEAVDPGRERRQMQRRSPMVDLVLRNSGPAPQQTRRPGAGP